MMARYGLYARNSQGEMQFMYAMLKASSARERRKELKEKGLFTAIRTLQRHEMAHPPIAPEGSTLFIEETPR